MEGGCLQAVLDIEQLAGAGYGEGIVGLDVGLHGRQLRCCQYRNCTKYGKRRLYPAQDVSQLPAPPAAIPADTVYRQIDRSMAAV